MKRGLLVIGIMLLAAPCMAATTLTLPRVELGGDCMTWIDIDSEAQQLLGTLSGFGVSGIPEYDLVDLENGMDGDGVPDKYQMALLSAVLCYGNPTIQGQFNANKATFNALIDDVVMVFSKLLGNPPTTATAADRLRAVATILTPLVPGSIPQTAVDAINNAATELDSFVASLPTTGDPPTPIITPSSLTTLQGTLKGFDEAVAALLGMDSELQGSVLNLLTDEIMGQVQSVEDQVQDIVDLFTPSVLALITDTEDSAYVNALLTDVDLIIAALDRTIALTVPGAIPVYGVVAKSASEPFAGVGDYDKNGYSNLTTYNALKTVNGGTPPTVEDFVAAATNPFNSINPNVPVAGLFGLAALAGACLTGGAFTLRRK